MASSENKEPKVPQRPFGSSLKKSNLPSTVPIIGLGCSSFSTFFWTSEEATKDSPANWTPETMDKNHPQVVEWIQTINSAVLDHGITLLDTAPWYGHGSSEVVIGWALQEILQKFDRKLLTVNTKVGRYEADPMRQFDYSQEMTMKSVQRSLQRMNVSYIDVLQLHDPEFAPSIDQFFSETIPALLECRDKGWCRALGMTGYPLPIQYQILQRTLTEFPNTTVWDQALTYGHFNLHDTSLVNQPACFPDQSFADYLQKSQMGLLAAAPLSMGLLTHSGPPEWHPASEDLQAACSQAALICESHGVVISTLAIVVALSHPQVPCTILGMKDRNQVRLAAAMANRYQDMQLDLGLPPSEILKQVLTQTEFKVWKILEDPNKGPFATIWKNGNYKWDGVQCVKDFWKQVDGVDAQEWQATE